MRYIAVAVGVGLAGVALAAALVGTVNAGSGPFSSWWLVSGIIFPVFGVVYGPLMVSAYDRGARSKHTVGGARWIPFVLIASALAVLGYYACSIGLASLQSEHGFFYLLGHPAEAPAVTTWGVSQLGRISEHANAPFDALVIGAPLGALGSLALIWQTWD
jgi:hypothetical protein